LRKIRDELRAHLNRDGILKSGKTGI